VRDVNAFADDPARRELDRAGRIRKLNADLQALLNKRRAALVLTRHEIGEIKGSARAIALGKAAMVNAIIVCRMNPRADTRSVLATCSGASPTTSASPLRAWRTTE